MTSSVDDVSSWDSRHSSRTDHVGRFLDRSLFYVISGDATSGFALGVVQLFFSPCLRSMKRNEIIHVFFQKTSRDVLRPFVFLHFYFIFTLSG